MDKYILGQSQIGSITEDNRETVLNLKLKKNTYYNNALIYGNVINSKEEKIEGAKITFFNECNKNIGSVYTSKNGFYTFFKAKINSKIKIVTEKSGYKTKVNDFIELCCEMFNFDICLKKSPMPKHTLISGHLVDEKNSPLKNITIYLLKNICNKTKIYKVTTTNPYGQFVFSKIPKGCYEVFINNPNFNIYNKFIEIKETNKIFDINITLYEKETRTRIIGEVKDYDNKPIPNSLVILFQVSGDGKLMPITYTLSNEKGVYSFTDIPYDNYIVKAKG